jgi:hypothetical protein
MKKKAVVSARADVGEGQSVPAPDFSLKQMLCPTKFVFDTACAFACVIDASALSAECLGTITK